MIPVTNTLDLEGNKITGLPTTTSGKTDAVSKNHLDATIRTKIATVYPVFTRGINNPPASEIPEGYRVIVGTSPTGVWVGHANRIAEWAGTVYEYTPLRIGLQTWVIDEKVYYTWDGFSWKPSSNTLSIQVEAPIVKDNTGKIKLDIASDTIDVTGGILGIKNNSIGPDKIKSNSITGAHVQSIPQAKIEKLTADMDDKLSSLDAEETYRKLDTPIVAAEIDGLSDVAITNSYDDLVDKPILGTAASKSVSFFATAAQGVKADNAVKSTDLSTVATTGNFNDITGKPTAYPATWSSVTGKPLTFVPSVHAHSISEVATLQSTLDSKYVKPGSGIPSPDIQSVDAAKVTTGILNSDRLPQIPIEKVTDLSATLSETLNKVGEVTDDPDPNGSILARVGYLEIDLANVSYEANRRLRRVAEEQTIGVTPVVISHVLGTADVTVTFMSITAPIKPVLDIDWEVENVDSIKVSSGTYTGTVRVLIDG